MKLSREERRRHGQPEAVTHRGRLWGLDLAKGAPDSRPYADMFFHMCKISYVLHNEKSYLINSRRDQQTKLAL